jgi:hypothetical protein
MLYRELLTSELHNQRADFQHFAETQASDLTAYLHVLHELQQTTSAEINEKLSKKRIPADCLHLNSTNIRHFQFRSVKTGQITKKPEAGQAEF